MNDTSQCFLIFQSQRQTSPDQPNQVKSSGLAQRYAFTSPRNCWSFEVDLNLYADLFQLDKSYSAVFVCGPISCGLTVLFPGRTVERTGKKQSTEPTDPACPDNLKLFDKRTSSMRSLDWVSAAQRDYVVTPGGSCRRCRLVVDDRLPAEIASSQLLGYFRV